MTLKQRAQDQFTAVESDLRDISRWMYENPEIAWEERETSARLAAFLTDKGFDVDYPAYGLETAFAARTGSEGPEVVICAEYDALPEVGHACGHNVIATAALGAGIALQQIADELGIRVTVLGTPAEEAYGGKVDLINAGAFSDAAASMMIHPSPMDVLDPDVLAVSHVDVEFHGKESHAAFAPQVGINALDAAVQAYVNVSTLRQAMYPTDKVHGVITYGGGAPNVVPALTKMSWYVRAGTQDRLRELYDKVVACFDGAARATGCTMEVSESGHTYEDLKSDRVLAELYQENSTALGRPLPRGAEMDSSASGSTDMGNVSHVVPSIHPFLGINSAPAVNHQKEFAAHTVTPDGEKAIRDGALGMAWTIIDLAESDRWGELGQSAKDG
ncbi:MAG: M20 family metallopeptidase [Acidimicrobiia bacterium]|nr:M20 family metallopeptidase [Acidimicrobiia bacterium]